MNRDQELKLNRVIKELQTIAAVGGGGGGATETTLAAIETKVSTAAGQTTMSNLLTDIKSGILALKDGEFRIFIDPNDNDRFVALSADMTNPASPTYVYKYLDTGAAYTGLVNDLEQVSNSVQTSIEANLNALVEKFDIKVRGAFFDLNNSTDDTFAGFPLTLGRIFVIYTAPGGTNFNEDIVVGTDAQKVNNMQELIAVLNHYVQGIIFENAQSASKVFIRNGTQSIANVAFITLNDINLNLEYDTFTPIPDEYNSNVDLVLESLKIIQNSLTGDIYRNWEYKKGNSKILEYYTGVTPTNPSGNKNIASIIFKTGNRNILRQQLAYDAADDIISITATN